MQHSVNGRFVSNLNGIEIDHKTAKRVYVAGHEGDAKYLCGTYYKAKADTLDTFHCVCRHEQETSTYLEEKNAISYLLTSFAVGL